MGVLWLLALLSAALADAASPANVLTVLIPSDVNPAERPARLRAIFDTWGKSLNTVVVCSEAEAALYTKGDVSTVEHGVSFHGLQGMKTLVLPPSIVKQMSGPAEEKFGPKVFLGGVDLGPTFDHLRYVFGQLKTLADKPLAPVDWIVLATDETFLVPENLLCFLATKSVTKPQFIAQGLKLDYAGGTVFPAYSGGAALNMAAVRLINQGFDSGDDKCKATNDWEQYNHAVCFGKCLKHLQLEVSDERDDTKGHRFNAFGPVRLVAGDADGWFQDYHQQMYGSKPEKGAAALASELISFHYVDDQDTRKIHEILHNQAGFEKMSDEQRQASWTHDGGYSRKPGPNDPVWPVLLSKIKIGACGPTALGGGVIKKKHDLR